MISYDEYAKSILLGETLEDKYFDAPIIWNEWRECELPTLPARSKTLAFSSEKVKFPKTFTDDHRKALAIHCFANHELLAIEMMAAAVLYYPHNTEDDVRFKKGIISALRDEQKHLKLYTERLNELGHSIGDFPLNDFFWRQMPKLKTATQYTAMMSLTFEAANLDFAQYYAAIFRLAGDERSAEILDIVLEDEISHVAFGAHWLKKWRADKTLWEYYLGSLPGPLTPSRSRGINYDAGLHGKAMTDEDFIEKLTAFDDNFTILKRVSML